MEKLGRKGKYDPEIMPQRAEEYAKAGYLDKQIAVMFGVRPDTFCKWQKKHELLSQALKRGREVANVELKQAMLKTAAGYDVVEEETVEYFDKNGNPKGYKKATRKRHIPPSTTMQIFLAKNRMPDEFRDVNRHEVDLQGTLKVKTLADLMLEEFMKDEKEASTEDGKSDHEDKDVIQSESPRP